MLKIPALYVQYFSRFLKREAIDCLYCCWPEVLSQPGESLGKVTPNYRPPQYISRFLKKKCHNKLSLNWGGPEDLWGSLRFCLWLIMFKYIEQAVLTWALPLSLLRALSLLRVTLSTCTVVRAWEWEENKFYIFRGLFWPVEHNFYIRI
jgi:hypothetical protein